MQPVQEWTLVENAQGFIEYPTQYVVIFVGRMGAVTDLGR